MAEIKEVDFERTYSTEVVEYLEDALAAARRGEIVDAVFCGTSRDGALHTFYTRTESRHKQLAGIEWLKFRIMQGMMSEHG